MFEVVRNTKISFMSHRKVAYALSLLVIVAGLASLAMKGGFRQGVDFAGGVLMDVRFTPPLDVDEVRRLAVEAGIDQAEIQAGERGEFLIRLPAGDSEAGMESAAADRLIATVQSSHPGVQADLLRSEFVGPKVGRQLRGQAFWAVTVSLILILIYVTVRYEFRDGLAGIAALAHDVLVVLAYMTLFNKEISIPVIAALLTVGGYSINDKVVVFDRLRERRKGSDKHTDAQLIDAALNETLSRTVVTGMSVIFTLQALIFFGGQVIHDFAVCILVGVIAGTYSSIYIGSGLVLDMVLRAERRKEARELLRATSGARS